MQIQYRGDFSGNGVTTYQYNGTAGMMVSNNAGGGFVMMMPGIKPPPSTQDRFVFPAEVFAHLPSFKMFPEYITASLPIELEGKIRQTEWSEWMQIFINDRQSHSCGDSFGCFITSLVSMCFACYPCIRANNRSKSMNKLIEKINTQLFVPRGMFLKLQEGYTMGVPTVPGMAQCSWFVIALNPKESEKLKKEPKRVPLSP